MKCARCGVGLDDDARVCGQCGAVVGMSYEPRDTRPQSFVSKPVAPQLRAPKPLAGAGRAVGLVDRVKGILGAPRREWAAIASEPSSTLAIYTGYAMPLAAIGALALFVTHVIVGERLPMLGLVRENLVDGLAGALLAFALALAHLFLLSRIVEALARKFGAPCDPVQALKLVAYSYTPIWLAGIAYLVPALSILWLVAAAYAMWIAFVGVPALTRCSPAQAAKVTLLAGGVAVLLFVVLGTLATALARFGPAQLSV